MNPTCTNNGSAKYKCTICGEVIEKELPALGHDWDGGVQQRRLYHLRLPP